jgi:hypothetical protein
VHIPDDRPHLEETRVLADRTPQTSAARRSGPVPLSRETAAQDTAEFRALPGADDDDTEEERTEALPSEKETQALPSERETQALPSEDETQRLGREDDEPPRLPGI